ncbi:hypothetical protein E6C27_scaffold157G00210 [Cucumis melo var. makuwa]|uniref:Uncharacterized protein n=1 Tax=Cucumis melo var. makuwa TaxID=1194695 RepID=A0A5A7TTA0_CUCMM|nr:hypothetical protein E6C27_scaffold157G00210 [Cucumis melo var. makuwa]
MPNRGPPTSLTIVTVVSGKSEINSFVACKLKGNNKNIENAIAKYEVILLMKEIKNYDNVSSTLVNKSPNVTPSPTSHFLRPEGDVLPGHPMGVGEVTFEFRNFTASAVETNSPLLGWIRLDADLNEILATSKLCRGRTKSPRISRVHCVYAVELYYELIMIVRYNVGITHSVDYLGNILEFELSRNIVRWFCIGCGVMVSFIYGVVYLTEMCTLRDHLTDMCKGTVRGRPTRERKDA